MGHAAKGLKKEHKPIISFSTHVSLKIVLVPHERAADELLVRRPLVHVDEPDLHRVVLELVVVDLALGGVVRGLGVQVGQVYVFGVWVHSHLDGDRLRVQLDLVGPYVPAIDMK